MSFVQFDFYYITKHLKCFTKFQDTGAQHDEADASRAFLDHDPRLTFIRQKTDNINKSESKTEKMCGMR